MSPITEKVLQRFNHEKVLISSDVVARRSKITLPDVMEAAREEPRIFEVLPAIVLYKPSVISKLAKDIGRFPEIKTIIKNLFIENKRSAVFHGVDKRDCAKAAITYKKFLEKKRSAGKSLMLSIRLSDEDLQRLKKLSEKLNLDGVSATIRYLARKEMTA